MKVKRIGCHVKPYVYLIKYYTYNEDDITFLSALSDHYDELAFTNIKDCFNYLEAINYTLYELPCDIWENAIFVHKDNKMAYARIDKFELVEKARQ